MILHYSTTFNSEQFLRVHLSFRMSVSLHSITNSRLIAGGQISSRERQTVFFTAVNPMNEDHSDPQELQLIKPRLTSYKQKRWKRHQNTVSLEAAKTPNESNQNPNNQFSRTVRLVGGHESTKEIEKGTLLDHEDVKHLTSTGDPYVDQNPQKVAC